jgi:peptidoglycan/xylan/chitin deacetylase (PgdA/CDA1 family)
MKSILYCFGLMVLISCSDQKGKTAEHKENGKSEALDSTREAKPADAATILARPEVPVLCYHDLRFGAGNLIEYTVTPTNFASQMKALHDSGYHTVLPDQLYDYLVYGKSLPSKPFMITFDDTDVEQFTVAKAEMDKYNFKAVYFLMTIAINRKRYMSVEQIKQLADEGHAIECHTWDHHMVTKYKGGTWDSQLVMPAKRIEDITGKKVSYFAYPFGLWNKPAIEEIKKRDYKMAFILSTKRDSINPLYTVRRMIVPGYWSTPGMLKAMKTTFD